MNTSSRVDVVLADDQPTPVETAAQEQEPAGDATTEAGPALAPSEVE